MNIDWLIIGGGIHGVHVAVRLLAEGEISREQLRIVDPADRLLDRWRRCTSRTGMTHLRSPSVHHLDQDPWALQRFAGKRKKRRPGLFAAPYDRPALDLFNAHCDHVLERYELSELHVQARAVSGEISCDGVTVALSDGRRVVAKNIVLAMGVSEQPHWPDWAPRRSPRVQHVFGLDNVRWPTSPETVAVVGGGISAGQTALRLMREGHRVHLLSRHDLRQHQFDSEPGWLGPKFMADFDRERDLTRRRKLIAAARHRGSIPPDVRRNLHRAIQGGEIQWRKVEVERLEEREGALELTLSDGASLSVDRVLLATGFIDRRPGGELVDSLIASASLPCAACGYPVVDSGLRWHPRVYVTGPLAELELGPTARNIAGARRAASKLVGAKPYMGAAVHAG